MGLPLYIVNAFTSTPFGGNPAAVTPLEAWLADDVLQAIAAQHNLSETAFLVQTAEDKWDLRWFTPAAEVDLCGHATLASAHALRVERGVSLESMRFDTRSGELRVNCSDYGYELDFPALKPVATEVESLVSEALGLPILHAVQAAQGAWKILCEIESEGQLRLLQPDMTLLSRAQVPGVIVTCRGQEVDFVSRFFAPKLGVDEDPVTGSAHCLLAPYWGEKLEKTVMTAKQLSARGGDLECQLWNDRVLLRGEAVTYAVGEVVVPV